MAKYTIWCPASVRDDFDRYCSLAHGEQLKQASNAFDFFHQIFADERGIRPPIEFTTPPLDVTGIEIEIVTLGVRFFIRVDFDTGTVFLDGITIHTLRFK